MSQPPESTGQGCLVSSLSGLPPEQTPAATAAAAAAAAKGFPQPAVLGPMDPSVALFMSDLAAQQHSGPLPPNTRPQQQQQQQQQPSALTQPPDNSSSPTAPPTSDAALLDTLGAALGLGPVHTGTQATAAADIKPLSHQHPPPLSPAAATPLSTADAAGGGPDPAAVAAALTARIASAGASVIFEKALTASDVSGGGRVVVPKSIAEQYFPRLDQPSGVTISATDLDGRSYTFKWRFWVNNSSRMYLLEGAGELHRNYGLDVGDVMVFAQKPDGCLLVAGRGGNKSDAVKRPPARRPGASAAAAGAGPGPYPSGLHRSRDGRGARAPSRPVLPAADAAAMAAGGPAGSGSAAGTAMALDGARGRKRKAASVPAHGHADPRFLRPRGSEAASLAVLDLEAPSDGIFRAVVTQHVTPVPLGVALARNNRWTATLEVAGEVYQAFFDSREDAVEALTAAGATP